MRFQGITLERLRCPLSQSVLARNLLQPKENLEKAFILLQGHSPQAALT